MKNKVKQAKGDWLSVHDVEPPVNVELSVRLYFSAAFKNPQCTDVYLGDGKWKCSPPFEVTLWFKAEDAA